MAPEYFMYGKVTDKIDVYAFGVVLLELLSGRKPISGDYPKGQESLVMWATPILNSGKVSQLLDPSLGDNYDHEEMERMVLAATLCIRRAPRARPQMSLISKLLRGDADVIKWARLEVNATEARETLDDEACPPSILQSHLNLALLDVEDDLLSMCSVEQNVSLEDYLRGRPPPHPLQPPSAAPPLPPQHPSRTPTPTTPIPLHRSLRRLPPPPPPRRRPPSLPYDLLPPRLPWNPNPNPRTPLPDDFDPQFHRHRPPIDRYDHSPADHSFPWTAPAPADRSPGYVRVYSLEFDADVTGRGSKRWLQDRGREFNESCSSLVNSGSSSSNNNSDKYYHHGSDLGRYSRGSNGRECVHEFARTPPKKQVQKKSALLRIQTVKPSNNHRNREVYQGYASSEFFRGKEREGSPVEIDISFESNSLVAKAIVAPPSSSVSVPDLNVTPDSDFGYGERIKRVSEGDCSGLPPVRVSSVIVDLNRSPFKGNHHCSVSGKKEVGVHNNVDAGSSRTSARDPDHSRGENKVPNSGKVGNVSSGKLVPRVVKKKKIVKRIVKKGTANSKAAVLKSLPAKRLPLTVKEESVAVSSATASGSEKIEANLNERSNIVGGVVEPDCLHKLPKEESVLKEDKEGGLLHLNLGSDSRFKECKSGQDYDIGKVTRFERNGNISKFPSCASSNEDKKGDYDCLDANNSVHDNANTSDCLDANNSLLNTDKVTKSLNGSTISEVNHMDHDNEKLCHNEVSLSPGKYSIVGSPLNRNLIDVGDKLFKSSDTFSSSEKTRIRDGLDCLQHASALKHTSNDGSSNLEDCVSVHCSGIMDDAGKQVSPGDIIISPENFETEKTFPDSTISAGSGEGDTNEIKKRKARTQLKFLGPDVECLSLDHVNLVSPADNVDGSSSSPLKDPCPSKVLNQSVQNLDLNSQSSLHGVTAIQGTGGVLEAQVYVGDNGNDVANEVLPASKRKKVTAGHPNLSQFQSEFSAVIVAPTSGAETSNSFSGNQEHEKEVSLSSMTMCISSTAHSMPYSEDIKKLSDNIMAGGSFESIKANKETTISKYLELQHSDIVSSPCEGMTYPNVQFSLSEGECRENITSIIPISITQTDILVVGDIIEERTDLQAVEENCQYREFVQRSPRADMKSNDLNMKNDLLSQQNNLSHPFSSDEVTTSNSNDELIEDAPGALSDIFSQGTAPSVLDRRILDSTAIHDENMCGDEENPDNASMVEHGSDLNTFTSSIQQTKTTKSDHAIGRSNLITKKAMSEQSQVSSKVPTQALNSHRSELSGTKNQSGDVIIKTFPSHSFTFSKSKTKTSASSTHVSNPRTWHRTGNNPPAPPHRIKPSVGTVPPRRPILERKVNFQNTSYVRKGNSLVRKPTPVSALPHISSVNQSSSFGLDEIPKNIKSESRADETSKSIKPESRADVTDQPMYLRTGAINALQQKQRTPPLPIDTKSEENATSSLVLQPSTGFCESASDPWKFIETNNNAPNSFEDALKHNGTPENQTGPSDNGESQVEANNGHIISLNTKRIVYIKPKTNQLVATSNSCDVSVSTEDNGQTAFSDGYYKRRKNQLVRTTFESHFNQTAAMPNSATNSDRQGTSNSLCNRRFSKKRSHKGERIFRIGSVRYRMDPSSRTLQRISDEDESLPSASSCSGLASKRPYIPRRLVIGNDEYVRIGNGNQLIRDPKKRTRKLANEKVRWSLHTARQRLARKQKYCQFFTRFGKCKKDGGKCPYIHDPSKVAVCTKFLNGLCSTPNCKLTHKCRKKHSYVCPTFEATGTCSEGIKCKLHHPKKQSKGKKRKRSGDQNNSRGRYFGPLPADVSESGMLAPKRLKQCGELEEELSDYINLDLNDEVEDTVDQSFEPAAMCDNDSLDLQLDDFDELVKPVLLMENIGIASVQ
ncbi:hypothetical protein Fmac_031721 [Flemingia macrophylla]|uniref:Uncharacterized protein n=1 Tax=Flemingia macrophylla TaxID=520843 RepID=A0ABD1L2V2_9FABA